MSVSASLSSQLSQGLEQLDCSLEPLQQQQLLDFVALLHKWNKTYNLTAVRDPAAMVSQHILDSLSVRPFLQGEDILDVGTGAGLPGIPLAIAEPARQFVLLDSNSKKTRFMTQAAAELTLTNIQVVHARIEEFKVQRAFGSIVSRAFATLADFISGCAHLCGPQTVLLAMKGRHPEDEIAVLPIGWQVIAEHKLGVPGVAGERRLIEIMQKK